VLHGHQLSDQVSQLDFESATMHIPHGHRLLLLSLKADIHFYCPMEGGRLSRRRHCS